MIIIKTNWASCQLNSEEILSEGLNHLFNSESKTLSYTSGNYLILHSEKPYYIGEAEDISKRLKTQFSQKHSTFYKNYIKYSSSLSQNELLSIEQFQVRCIETKIGRKEVEEFGIVNLPTILNKFQKGKRQKKAFSGKYKFWEDIQNNNANLFLEGEDQFFNQTPIDWDEAALPTSPGLYRVLNVDKQLIYIGESSDIKARYTTHSKDTYFSALRRHIATDILGFKLIEKRKLSEENEYAVNQYLSQCSIGFIKVLFGRYELEKFLIKKYLPNLNKKDK